MKKLILYALVFSLTLGMFTLGGCKSKDSDSSSNASSQPKEQAGTEHKLTSADSQLEEPVQGEQIAVMHTTQGDIYFRLFPDVAPKAVENFVEHAKAKYYDGMIFHRVINDFMIQSGDPTGTGTGGESIWGKDFGVEANANARHYRGALSMANTGQPNSNGSQFFVVQNKTVDTSMTQQMETLPDNFSKEVIENYKKRGGYPSLDGSYTVFGQAFKGLDVVDKIAATETAAGDKPITDIKITGVDITTFEG